jgi:thiamine transport system substrate-binding protein
MKISMVRFLSILLMAAFLAACGSSAGSPTATPPGSPATGVTPAGTAQVDSTSASANPATLTVMTHDSFAASEGVIRQFEQENNVKLVFLKSGDAGAALNRAILSKDSPQADVLYGVDNTFLSRALESGIFDAYNSPALADIPAEFKLDPQNQALPVDYGDVCINYDKAYFAGKNLPVPQTLDDLKKPDYKGLLVTENPATSSPGLAFLLATIKQYGEDGYIQYWKDLRANGLVVVNDWETAYYTNFSASTGKGPQPMVVSYGSSPVAEVVFAENPPAESPTASIVGPNTCSRQIEFVGILKGTKQRALAEKFVDFMLSKTFQEDMPLQMFVYPVNQKAVLPEPFHKFAQVPDQPAALDPQVIAKNRDAWIQAWDTAVLR